MKLRKLDTENRRDVQQFVDFPFDLYCNCEQWVPPLVSSTKFILNRRKHPFYKHSVADYFVVESGGQTVGRMAMLENRNYNGYKKRDAAFFGYFDVVDDFEVACCLFETGFAWAKSRGLNEILGPRGVMGVDGSVLVDGFEHRAALGMFYNYPYYDRLIKAFGFEKDSDYLSGYRKADDPLSPRFYDIAERVKSRRKLWVKQFDSKAELRQWTARIIDAHHQAFSQLRTYYPPTDDEIELVIKTLLTVVDPQLVKLVMKGDDIIGFLFAYHDVSEGLRKANGRLWPLGWYHLLRDRKRTTWLNVNAVGLLPAHRGVGANTLLYTELEKAIDKFGFKHLDMVMIDERNAKSMADMENIGVTWYKRHRYYRRDVE